MTVPLLSHRAFLVFLSLLPCSVSLCLLCFHVIPVLNYAQTISEVQWLAMQTIRLWHLHMQGTGLLACLTMYPLVDEIRPGAFTLLFYCQGHDAVKHTSCIHI